ncbi:MAG: ATP-binding protein [Clostridia bacterium]|nr:ATP-binding protein [Clostridia bacterium]
MNYQKIAYQNVKSLFQKTRQEKMAAFEKRKNSIHESNPEIAEIDKEIISNLSTFTRLALSGGSASLENAKKKDKELKEKRKSLLKSMNLPEDYLDLKYNCDKCSDYGFIGAETCQCFKEELKKEEIRLLKNAAKAMENTFSAFDLNYYRKDHLVAEEISEYDYMTFVKSRAEEFCRTLTQNKKGIIFAGNTGTGKTFLSKCVYNCLVEQGEDVVFDYAQNLFDKTEKEKYSNIGYEYTDKIMNCSLLIIDDLGSEMVTPFSTAMLYNILNIRQEKGLLNLITTNLEPDGLMKKYENRIVSRLMGYHDLLLFKGRDIRQLI